MTRAYGVLAGAFALLASTCVQASPLYSGQVAGTWSNPVLTGNLIDGVTGASTFMNNTATAACNLTGCPNAASGGPPGSLAWGVNPETSIVAFLGSSFSGVAEGEVFRAGTIIYGNRTSSLESLIFGAQLTLTFTMSLGDQVDPLVISMPIVTTDNTGTQAQNADWIGPFGTPSPQSLNVFEGETATADLFGMIVGDPQFSPQIIMLTSPGSTGFIGNGQPLVTVPEPATAGLLGLALASLLAVRRRRS